MGSDIGVKMGVTGIAQFKQAMNQANQSVKTFDAALKLNEKQLQATGDKETYMQNKSKLLQQQISAQNKVVAEGQKALAAMEKNGVDPASQAYQKMQQQVLSAQDALLDMNSSLNNVGQSADETAQKTDKLTDSLNSINQKVSFDAVLNGIGKITDGMEAAARKVASLARDVWDTMTAAATWADDENTLAAMYGIDVETLQRMQGASRTIDTSVEAIIKSQQKLKQNMVYGSNDVQEAFKKLGISIGYVTGKENEIQVFRDSTDVFWEAGEALKNYNDEVERDAMAQKIFGRGWQELMPLFTAGREEYERTLAEQNIVTEENVNKLNELDDALQRLDQDYQAMKKTILAQLAPAFTKVTNALSGFIEQINEYLQTEEGKEKLEALSKAVEELFDDLTDGETINAASVVGGALDAVKDALNWIKNNRKGVVDAIKAIGAAFLGLKAAEIAGTLIQSAAGLKVLLGGGNGSASGGTNTTSGGNAPIITGGSANATTFWSSGSWLLDGLGIAVITKTWNEVFSELLDNKFKDAQVMQFEVEQNTGTAPKRKKNITGTASEDSLKGTDQLSEERLQEALDEAVAGKTLTLSGIDPELSPNAETMLQNTLNEMQLHAPVIPDLTSLLPNGSHANGLPFVPFDGYIAALHKGERVVPASQNKSYSFTSNTYFDRTQLNNGTDVDGLAAAIAEQNRRAMAGFGG